MRCKYPECSDSATRDQSVTADVLLQEPDEEEDEEEDDGKEDDEDEDEDEDDDTDGGYSE